MTFRKVVSCHVRSSSSSRVGCRDGRARQPSDATTESVGCDASDPSARNPSRHARRLRPSKTGTPADPGRRDPGRADLVRPGRRTGRGRAPPGRPRHPARARRRRRAVAVVDPRRAGGVRRERGLEVERLLGQERLGAGRPGSPYAVRVTAVWIAASGSGVLTGQSLPATSRAPARCRSPKGYCQRPAPAPGTAGSARPSASSWQAQSACMLAATPSAAKRGRRRGGPAGGARCGGAGRPGGAGALERVERLAHPAVADRVHVHLEARGGQRRDGLAQRVRRRRTSGRCCRSRARSGRGTARPARRCRSRRRRPA